MANYLNTFTFTSKIDAEEVMNPFTLVRLVNFDGEDVKWTVDATDVEALTANAVAVRTREIEKGLETAQEANRLLTAWNDDKARKLNGALSEVRQFIIDNEVWDMGGGQAFIDEMVEYGMEPLTKKYRFEVTCSFTAEGEVVVEMDASEHDIRVAIQEAVTQESFHLSDYDDGEVSVAFDDSYAGVEVDDTSMYEC